MNKKLSEIEYRLQMIKNLHPAHEHDKEEMLIELYENGSLDWLVTQSKQLEIAEKALLYQCRYAGMSADHDARLWKKLESYFGGRDKARKLLEVSTE